jgi:hypothetical protein
MNSTPHEHQHTFLNMSRSFILRMRNASDKIGTVNQNTHFVFSDFFSFENRAVYEVMWKNIVVVSVSVVKCSWVKCVEV